MPARRARHRRELPDSIAVYRSKIAEVDAYLARLHEVRTELHAQLHAALLARAPEPRCALDVQEVPR